MGKTSNKSSSWSSGGGGGSGSGGRGNSLNGRKRKYYNPQGGGGGRGGSGSGSGGMKQGNHKNNPKRGGPGMLLTCETGRERKCQNEGIDILTYYLSTVRRTVSLSSGTANTNSNDNKNYIDNNNDDSDNDDCDDTTGDTNGDGPLMTLEEELMKLKSNNTKISSTSKARKGQSLSSSFGVYDTGCRGSVFVLCTVPNCQLIPPIQTEYILQKQNEEKTTPSTTPTTATVKSDEEGLVHEGDDSTPTNNGGAEDGTEEESSFSTVASKKHKKFDVRDGTSERDKGNTTTSTTTTIATTADQEVTTTLLPLTIATTEDDNIDDCIVAKKISSNTAITSPDTNNNTKDPVVWDPIASIQMIIADLDAKSTRAPSSRFVTRMVPIQATCFASLEELKLTAIELFKLYLPTTTTKTFGIVVQRRHCDSLTRSQIIDTIGTIISDMIPTCVVQLQKPDVTIMVEICKTICGISVIADYDRYRKFNLFTAKDE
jgi:tRNA(Ser,Leu) C12 N-acetylase TAN1